MTRNRTQNRRLAVTAIVFVAFCAAFLAVTYLGWLNKEQRIQNLMQLSLLFGVVWIYLLRDRMHGRDWLTVAILFAGMVMRVGYSLYTPTTLRFHDLAPIDIRATGHAGYVLNLFENGALPTSNAFQYAQPPLYYAIAALSMRVYQGLTGLTNTVDLFEAVRLPSCIASCATLLVAYQIGKDLRLGQGGMRVLTAVCAFLPNHYLLAGRANPDGLSVFFLVCVVWFALRWYQAQTPALTVLLALSFGLGMMTKMTVAVLAFPVGGMMTILLYQRIRLRNAAPLLRQLALFLIIAVPLGLWYPIRNAVLFGQPLNNVYQMSLTDPQYIGDLSFWQRYGLFDPHSLISSPYVNWSTDANVYLYLLKTSVFGEFRYGIDPLVPLILMAGNIALVALSLGATAWAGKRALCERDGRWILLVSIWFATLLAYLLFTVRYPFYCSMDYRYGVLTSLIGALTLAKAFDVANTDHAEGRVFRSVLALSLTVFAAASVVMYCNVA